MKTEVKTTEEKIKKIKKLVGLVVSDKMDKTRVISITERRTHPIYQKTFLKTRKIKAHDENNEFKNGQMVEIVETRPYAKSKSWKIVRSISDKPSKAEQSLDGSVK